uniref:Uncharacterized protein n=1 Tax=Lutzomyia longipalpis TaxID=7200 RepID=A0A1B0GI12_LUTLO
MMNLEESSICSLDVPPLSTRRDRKPLFVANLMSGRGISPTKSTLCGSVTPYFSLRISPRPTPGFPSTMGFFPGGRVNARASIKYPGPGRSNPAIMGSR